MWLARLFCMCVCFERKFMGLLDLGIYLGGKKICKKVWKKSLIFFLEEKRREV